MKKPYNSSNHSKFSIQYHIILTTKYRKPLLAKYGNDVVSIIKNIEDDFEIQEIGVDTDHVHFLVSTKPNISASLIVKKVKAITTQMLWDMHPDQLKVDFWGKRKYHIFWSPSFFACTIGILTQERIRDYIKNQGNSSPKKS